jgi:hypothetical protein
MDDRKARELIKLHARDGRAEWLATKDGRTATSN